MVTCKHLWHWTKGHLTKRVWETYLEGSTGRVDAGAQEFGLAAGRSNVSRLVKVILDLV